MNQSSIDAVATKFAKVAAIVSIAIVIIVALATGIPAILRAAQQTGGCTVGVVGTAASITFTSIDNNTVAIGDQPGTPAQADCKAVVSCAPQRYYNLTASKPTGTVMCEGDFTTSSRYSSSDLPPGLYAGVHYIVQDTGILDVVGYQLCHDINMPAP